MSWGGFLFCKNKFPPGASHAACCPQKSCMHSGPLFCIKKFYRITRGCIFVHLPSMSGWFVRFFFMVCCLPLKCGANISNKKTDDTVVLGREHPRSNNRLTFFHSLKLNWSQQQPFMLISTVTTTSEKHISYEVHVTRRNKTRLTFSYCPKLALPPGIFGYFPVGVLLSKTISHRQDTTSHRRRGLLSDKKKVNPERKKTEGVTGMTIQPNGTSRGN